MPRNASRPSRLFWLTPLLVALPLLAAVCAVAVLYWPKLRSLVSIVMKLVRVHGEPVVKFSDDPVKNVCEDASFLQYAAQVFNVGKVEV